ncbi:DNA-3-methyladenine glycosylase [Bradyrhizobium sp. 17]|uniref:DNA-3-methyladenine glycosylase n=1 Tax=Bradyrhizobium sp. 17 TaxID=2782649 RepID=UPI001FF90B9C|nr:DNA-3-methyladenine glycosylase [Bradyrhizobium sp. 17]MCK1520467.1 DNA-3-methyladenine glycosylase [Bradyrhizobium sp. 17]
MIDQKSCINASPLKCEFFDRPAEVVAPDLIGCFLFFELEGKKAGGMIVETEAYDESDYASHCYSDECRRPRPYSKPMRLAPAHLYIYENGSGAPSINFVTDRVDYGSAVLIRAIEPAASSQAIMIERHEKFGRKDFTEFNLCNGPTKICDAVGIDRNLYKKTQEMAVSILEHPFDLRMRTGSRQIVCGPRVGIQKQLAKEPPECHSRPEARLAIARYWRFGLAGSKHVSPTQSFTQYVSKSL